MTKSFEINMTNKLKLKELAAIAMRIEIYQSELNETLSDRQKMMLGNLM